MVLADADLERAADGAIRGIFFNAGQVCAAGARLICEESVHEALREKVIAQAEKLSMGHPLADPDMGPLVSRAHSNGSKALLPAQKQLACPATSVMRQPLRRPTRTGSITHPPFLPTYHQRRRSRSRRCLDPCLRHLPVMTPNMRCGLPMTATMGWSRGSTPRTTTRLCVSPGRFRPGRFL